MNKQMSKYLRIILAVFFAALLTAPAVRADTVFDIPLQQEYEQPQTEYFSIFRENSVGGPTEVYGRMVFPFFTSISLKIDMPISEQATLSWDLLAEDRQTVLLSYEKLRTEDRASWSWLFRGTLPAGTYYLRLRDFGRGCSAEFKNGHKTKITTTLSRSYRFLQEDDQAGSNDTMETAAVLSDEQEGYLSIAGDDPQDWYTFTVTSAGADLSVYPGENEFDYVSYTLLRRDAAGTTVLSEDTHDLTTHLEEGTYYLCMKSLYFEGAEIAPPKRGGCYSIYLKQKEAQPAPENPGPSASDPVDPKPLAPDPADPVPAEPDPGNADPSDPAQGALPAGSVVTVSGQKYLITKEAGSGAKGAASLQKAANAKSVSVPAYLKLGGETFQVTAVEAKAFTGSKIRKVTIGSKVKTLKKNAFYGSKATKVVLKTKKLAKSRVKGCLKNSAVKTIEMNLGSKSLNTAYAIIYRPWFTKANAGRAVTVN